MSVKIRMTRMGKKKKPFYRIVAADIEAPRDGKFLEVLGTYDPLKDPVEIKVNQDKVDKWLGLGAIPSTTVKSLLAKIAPAAKQRVEELIRHIALALVDDPEAVELGITEKDDCQVIGLRVAESDLGKVIGKQGRTARAMRSLLNVAAGEGETPFRLEILEQYGGYLSFS